MKINEFHNNQHNQHNQHQPSHQQQQQSQPQPQAQASQISYQPMQHSPQMNSNVGVSMASLSQEDINKIINGIQTASQHHLTSLQSRDIPMNVSSITQDPSVKPNYIPGQGGSGGVGGQHHQTKYIDSIEASQNKQNQQQSLEEAYLSMKNKQKKQEKTDELFDEIQTPILIVILFFLFQMPVFNKVLYQYFPSFFIADGNLGLGGYLFKSALFGALYFVIMKFMNYLSVV
jgi:hypothetical protein